MNELRKGGVRLFFTIPNIFTLSNLALGFLSIYHSILGQYKTAFLLIVAAMICDALDGFTARKLRKTNELGKELDSLSDQVSFGVAPSVMLVVYINQIAPTLIYIAILIAVLFSSFGALRLARFNIYGSKEFFEGLAIPAAAFFGTLINLLLVPIYPLGGILLFGLVGLLMITSIAYPSTKTKVGIYSVAIIILVSFALWGLLLYSGFFALGENAVLFLFLLIMAFYASLGPIVFYVLRKTNKKL